MSLLSYACKITKKLFIVPLPKGRAEDEMAGWHHWLDGHEFEWTPRVGDGQGGLACCSSWGHKELEMTERLNWTELLPTSPQITLHHRKRVEAAIMSDSVTAWTVSPLGSYVHEIFQAKILEWFAILFSRGSSQPRHVTSVFCFSCFSTWIL